MIIGLRLFKSCIREGFDAGRERWVGWDCEVRLWKCRDIWDVLGMIRLKWLLWWMCVEFRSETRDAFCRRRIRRRGARFWFGCFWDLCWVCVWMWGWCWWIVLRCVMWDCGGSGFWCSWVLLKEWRRRRRGFYRVRRVLKSIARGCIELWCVMCWGLGFWCSVIWFENNYYFWKWCCFCFCVVLCVLEWCLNVSSRARRRANREVRVLSSGIYFFYELIVWWVNFYLLFVWWIVEFFCDYWVLNFLNWVFECCFRNC